MLPLDLGPHDLGKDSGKLGTATVSRDFGIGEVLFFFFFEQKHEIIGAVL